MDNRYEIIFTILNRGYSDLAMDSARKSGATGGTIITARGTGAKEMENLFGITVSQEKEIILILTPKEKRNAIMTAICKSAGLNTQGKGITFSMPVDDVLGVSFGIKQTSAFDKKDSQKVSTGVQTSDNLSLNNGNDAVSEPSESENTSESSAEHPLKTESPSENK